MTIFSWIRVSQRSKAVRVASAVKQSTYFSSCVWLRHLHRLKPYIFFRMTLCASVVQIHILRRNRSVYWPFSLGPSTGWIRAKSNNNAEQQRRRQRQKSAIWSAQVASVLFNAPHLFLKPKIIFTFRRRHLFAARNNFHFNQYYTRDANMCERTRHRECVSHRKGFKK